MYLLKIHYYFDVKFFNSSFYYFILYSEQQYFSLIIDMSSSILQLISVLKKVPLITLLYYLLITVGYSISIISIKIFVIISLMISNIIDIYLLGIMIVLIN